MGEEEVVLVFRLKTSAPPSLLPNSTDLYDEVSRQYLEASQPPEQCWRVGGTE